MVDRFEGCIAGGAIGDAWGSAFENTTSINQPKTYYWNEDAIAAAPENKWQLSDDTQLTLATCEALAEKNYSPQILAGYFLQYYKQNKLRGIGASTLKAIVDLQAGIHWTQSGRSGEFAAGNGVAMRIAPFAFFPFISKEDIYDATRITHRNDEAYAGALAVYLSIKAILEKKWNGYNSLIEIAIPQLPDTNVRDRLITINNSNIANITEAAKLGNSGYVVDSVPLAIYAASQSPNIGMIKMFEEIIQAGGDTDTNASIAGQIAGCLAGIKNIPNTLAKKLQHMPDYFWMKGITDKTKNALAKYYEK